jgi:hypothetical protein
MLSYTRPSYQFFCADQAISHFFRRSSSLLHQALESQSIMVHVEVIEQDIGFFFLSLSFKIFKFLFRVPVPVARSSKASTLELI